VSREVVVPPGRVAAWFTGFVKRNGAVVEIRSDVDGTHVVTDRGGLAHLPGRGVAAATLDDLVAALLPPGRAVVALVRRGGFSIASVSFDGPVITVERSKTGTRYVQGRTAAGGQSQQRFARRRANQADALVGGAVDAASRVLGEHPAPVDLLVTGGDPKLVDDLLGKHPLDALSWARRVHVPVGEPRRVTVDEAMEKARAVTVVVTNAGGA
jgi:hypothetical protein